MMTRMPRQMYDIRPLNSVELTPPDYRINSQHLQDSCVEMDIKFCGIIPEIPATIDSTSRTDVLRVIDRGRKEKFVLRTSQDAIFYLNAHNIKLLTRDSNEYLLLRLPLHQVAALSYIQDGDTHILAIKYGSCDVPRPQSSIDEITLCNMVVLYCETRRRAEELCALVDQCFQIIYTESTSFLFDRNAMRGPQAYASVGPASVDFSYTDKSRESTPKNGSRNDPPASLGFLSHSSLDLGTSSSATSRSMSRGTVVHGGSDTELSAAADQLILDYMHKLYNKLSADELQRFALLVKAWHTELSFPHFINSVLDLYGTERTYLLVEMRPFIPAKDLAYFEQFIDRMEIANSQQNSTPAGRGFRGGSSSGGTSRNRQNSLNDDSVMDDFDMLNDLNTSRA